MKYAMIVALALLGACAPDDAEPGDEGASEVTTTAQAPLGQVTVKVADVPVAQPPAVKAQPAANRVFQMAATGFKPGSDIVIPHTDPEKPQPQPWVPPDQGNLPDRDEPRDEPRAIPGTASQGNAP